MLMQRKPVTNQINAKPVENVAEVKSAPYAAFAVVKKPGSGGLYVMRRIIIHGDKVIQVVENTEDLFTIQAAKAAMELDTTSQ